MSKCEFFKPELKFLGHLISANGMRPDPKKVAAVQEWPVPANVYEVRSFLGLSKYFRKYIKGYSAIAAPLSDMLKGLTGADKQGKLVRWNRLSSDKAERMRADFASRWTPACAAAFSTLKSALTTAPVLALPDFNKPFELVADACGQPPAVGALLLQDGRPVAFHSRKLSGPELNYSVSDIEMLAVITALREWRCYLEGASFTIVTDHKPNTYLDVATSAHTVKRRAHWLDVSCGYDYVWVYRPGRVNVADPVSRAPQHFAGRPTPLQLVQSVRRAGHCPAHARRISVSTPPEAEPVLVHSRTNAASTAASLSATLLDWDAGLCVHSAGTTVPAGGNGPPDADILKCTHQTCTI